MWGARGPFPPAVAMVVVVVMPVVLCAKATEKRNTLTARGLKELISSCAVVSVFGSGRK
jgi:hypothetical protein